MNQGATEAMIASLHEEVVRLATVYPDPTARGHAGFTKSKLRKLTLDQLVAVRDAMRTDELALADRMRDQEYARYSADRDGMPDTTRSRWHKTPGKPGEWRHADRHTGTTVKPPPWSRTAFVLPTTPYDDYDPDWVEDLPYEEWEVNKRHAGDPIEWERHQPAKLDRYDEANVAAERVITADHVADGGAAQAMIEIGERCRLVEALIAQRTACEELALGDPGSTHHQAECELALAESFIDAWVEPEEWVPWETADRDAEGVHAKNVERAKGFLADRKAWVSATEAAYLRFGTGIVTITGYEKLGYKWRGHDAQTLAADYIRILDEVESRPRRFPEPALRAGADQEWSFDDIDAAELRSWQSLMPQHHWLFQADLALLRASLPETSEKVPEPHEQGVLPKTALRDSILLERVNSLWGPIDTAFTLQEELESWSRLMPQHADVFDTAVRWAWKRALR